jgi:hypothetical protein
VLIHHALLCSSFDWVGLGPQRSLGTSVCLSVRLVPIHIPFHPSLLRCDAVCRGEWLADGQRQTPATSLRQLQTSPLCLYIFLIMFVPLFQYLSFLILFYRVFYVPPNFIIFRFFIFLSHNSLLKLIARQMFVRTSVCQTFDRTSEEPLPA